jgi:hypothetical protein
MVRPLSLQPVILPEEDTRAMGLARPQKAFAIAFAALAAVLAGCASGLGAAPSWVSSPGLLSRIEEGRIVAVSRAAVADPAAARPMGSLAGSLAGNLVVPDAPEDAAAAAGFTYIVRLRTGELAPVFQNGLSALPEGAPVVIHYGASVRLIPQNASIGYS